MTREEIDEAVRIAREAVRLAREREELARDGMPKWRFENRHILARAVLALHERLHPVHPQENGACKHGRQITASWECHWCAVAFADQFHARAEVAEARVAEMEAERQAAFAAYAQRWDDSDGMQTAWLVQSLIELYDHTMERYRRRGVLIDELTESLDATQAEVDRLRKERAP